MTVPQDSRFRPDEAQLDTPHGKLRVVYPRGHVVFDGLEELAVLRPSDPEPLITLNGTAITRKRALEVIAGMRVRMQPPSLPIPLRKRDGVAMNADQAVDLYPLHARARARFGDDAGDLVMEAYALGRRHG